ncbi:MAG TPA: hypothetical protein VJC37_03265 [Planctomycetota bacterium]|nr:hypothetical protein [Planctomycetota bacterium]
MSEIKKKLSSPAAWSFLVGLYGLCGISGELWVYFHGAIKRVPDEPNILAIIALSLISLLAIILGLRGIRQIKENQALSGKVLAKLGIILGISTTLIGWSGYGIHFLVKYLAR